MKANIILIVIFVVLNVKLLML